MNCVTRELTSMQNELRVGLDDLQLAESTRISTMNETIIGQGSLEIKYT